MHNLTKLLSNTKAKFIFISGGVISGLGKGTTAAALATLLESAGYKVFPIKVDMYLNIDAGTMNPLEHGETFVTQDGLECDQDIGTYERFLDRNLSRKNYFTAGQVYKSLLDKERQLEYNGACVEAFPHIPYEIVEHIFRYSEDTDVVIVEYGGTVGEYQNEAFFEAARMMVAASKHQVCFVHIGYILNPPSLGEMKSKPMQMSIRGLNQLGIFPDVIVCRSEKPIDKPRLKKISTAAGLPENHIFSCPNVNSIYKLPHILKSQKILEPIFAKLGLKPKPCHIPKWDKVYTSIDKSKPSINLGIIAKYYTSGQSYLKDSYISVLEAIKHAAINLDLDINLIWVDSESLIKDQTQQKKLASCDATIVPQGWGNRGAEGKIHAIKYIREHEIPYLGLCYGMQMACVEYARNILNLRNANSEEVDPNTPHPIIHIMPNQKQYLTAKQYGGTIRLGAWPCKLKKDSLIEQTYNKHNNLTIKPFNNLISERHRHRYEFNNKYKEDFEKSGFIFSGLSPDNQLVEAIEIDQKIHPYFIATQFHPELISRPFNPHPLFVGLLKAALNKN
jgi:CTP synthase